jgi:hypothetical protein
MKRERMVNFMLELDYLISAANQLSAKADFWNSAILWALLFTAVAPATLFFAQKIALDRGKQLSSLQQKITNIKESNMKQRAENLEQANLQLSLDLEKEKGRVARLGKDANDARAAQQTVEIKLAEQTERTALAERTLLEVQERVKKRTLSLEREIFLINLLKQVQSKLIVAVDCVAGDSDGLAAADQIEEIIVAAGWRSGGINIESFLHNPVGLSLIVGKSVDPSAGVLQHAFGLAGIPLKGVEDDSVPGSEVEIMVGTRP